MQYQVLTSYRDGLLKPMWQSLTAELINAETFNGKVELPLNDASKDRLGEIAAAIIAINAGVESESLENDIKQNLTPELEALYDFRQSSEYNIKRALQDLSGSRTMITDVYYISDVIAA